MKKPVLVIMAAGMGSRYGGLKQIDPIDDQGHIIMDFSIFDAKKAGFEKVVFIIKKENEAAFKETIGNRLAEKMEVSYVYQDLKNLPEGMKAPEGREKPWGTGHAVLSAANEIEGPFAVINADDYYGSKAFDLIYRHLLSESDKPGKYAMVGYILSNTLSENGHVARGVCKIDNENFLTGITERTHIEKGEEGPRFTEDKGENWTSIAPDTLVSMNMWGFTQDFLIELRRRFPRFLKKALKENPMGGEYFLPSVVGELLEEGMASVKVLKSTDRWYGVTYKEDKPVVMEAIRSLEESGAYEGL